MRSSITNCCDVGSNKTAVFALSLLEGGAVPGVKVGQLLNALVRDAPSSQRLVCTRVP